MLFVAALLASGTPVAALNCRDLSELDTAITPSVERLWTDLETMVGYGPRHTGYEADRRWVDFLEAEMRRMGLEGITSQKIDVLDRNGFTTAGVQTTGLTARHLWGFLPGRGDNLIVLGVHSDGQNSIEENGTIALLRTMEYLTKVPRECRRYSFALVFVTCHMATCRSGEAPGWAENHPDIMARTVAFISPEHMGQRSRAQDQILSWSLWANTANFRAAAQRFIGEMGIEPMTVGAVGLGTANFWRESSHNKPVIGGMANPWVSYPHGLIEPGIDRPNINIDRAAFHKLTLLFIRIAGYIDGLSTDEMRE